MHFVDRNAGERHEQALSLLSRAGRADCFLTLQSLGEFFHIVTRKGKMAPTDAAKAIDIFRAAFPVHAAGPAVLGRWCG